MSGEPTFEELRAGISAASSAALHGERQITWVDPTRTLAYSRDEASHLELFLAGRPLTTTEPSVQDRLVHNSWIGAGGTPFEANRLVLPAGDHIDAVAATTLIELLRNGFPSTPELAFSRTERLIALALTDSVAASDVLTGLAGELLTLVSLLRAADLAQAEAIFDSWKGWQRSSRDFQLGTTGIEVKTTTTGASRHHIQGWYQVEPGVSADGTVETAFYILSIGIRWLADGGPGESIEGLVEQVLQRIPRHRHADFIDAVGAYTGRGARLDSDGLAAHTSLRRPFLATFERLYDMSDDRIRVPRFSDFSQFAHLERDSVSFEIVLPKQVRGDLNPRLGMSAVAASLRPRQ